MFGRASETEKHLLKEFGVFNARTNSKGMVRDHQFSRKSGFQLGVFPELLRHPENCQIISHSENVRKRAKRYIDGDSITLSELFKRITKYNGDWQRQELCLELVDRYKNGKRWKRKE